MEAYFTPSPEVQTLVIHSMRAGLVISMTMLVADLFRSKGTSRAKLYTVIGGAFAIMIVGTFIGTTYFEGRFTAADYIGAAIWAGTRSWLIFKALIALLVIWIAKFTLFDTRGGESPPFKDRLIGDLGVIGFTFIAVKFLASPFLFWIFAS